MMLAEWASAEPIAGDPAGVTKGQWIIDAANAMRTKFPRIRAAIWFNLSNTKWALNSSTNSMAGARTAFGGCGSTAPAPRTSAAPKPKPVARPTPVAATTSPTPAGQAPVKTGQPSVSPSSATGSPSPKSEALVAFRGGEPAIAVVIGGAALVALVIVSWFAVRLVLRIDRRRRRRGAD